MKSVNVLIVTLIIITFSLTTYVVITYPRLLSNKLINYDQTPSGTPLPSQDPKDLLLPDISIKTPKEIYLSRTNNKKLIRFSTTFVNVGTGSLELIGHLDEVKQKTFATQYIKKKDGTGLYREIGEFVFHPAHRHWHVDNYVNYQLWSIIQDQRDKMVANTGKQSFCIWDEHLSDPGLNGVKKSRFYTSNCDQNTQGLSIGWGDTYKASIEGQSIDITEVQDGDYLFISEVNPEKKIIESNYDNNQDIIKINIKGNKLTVLK